MSEKAGRRTLRRKKFWSFLVVDALALTFLLGAFAGTQDCTGEAGVATVIQYNTGPGMDTIRKTVTNNTVVPGRVLVSDQMIGLKIRNALSANIVSFTHSGGDAVRIDPCPPAVRQLNAEHPPAPHERWIAFLTPAIGLDPGESLELVYTISGIVNGDTAEERATALGCTFSDPARSYHNSLVLTTGGGGGGSVPSLSTPGRLALLGLVVAAGALLARRRSRWVAPACVSGGEGVVS